MHLKLREHNDFDEIERPVSRVRYPAQLEDTSQGERYDDESERECNGNDELLGPGHLKRPHEP